MPAEKLPEKLSDADKVPRDLLLIERQWTLAALDKEGSKRRMGSPRRQVRGEYTEAAKLLWSIKEDNDRLDLVLGLQQYLIRNISQCEKRVPRLRKVRARCKRYLARSRLTKERARVVKQLIAGLDKRIKSLHHAIFLWRCFGDGIAFIYQSKYALKHLFYDGEYMPKQGPGFISGKSGFRTEYKVLKKGIQMNVPIVLSDLTNVIRHGDLCALAGEDPLVIEMKSSRNTNARTERQVSGMREIAQFFHDDYAESFRGMPNVHRVEVSPGEVNHSSCMNECVRDALAVGGAVRHPEPGLTYLAFNAEFAEDFSRIQEYLEREAGPGSVLFVLTPDETWLPSYPFTLSIEPSIVVPFMQGEVHVAVFINALEIKRRLAERGMTSWGLMDGTWAFQIAVNEGKPDQSMFRVSERNFGRIAIEFQSLEWWVSAQVALWNENAPKAATHEGATYHEFPKEWLETKCCFVPCNSV